MFSEHFAQGVFVDSAVDAAQNLKSEAETIQPLSFKTSCLQLPQVKAIKKLCGFALTTDVFEPQGQFDAWQCWFRL